MLSNIMFIVLYVCVSMYVQVICIQEKDLEGYIVSFFGLGFCLFVYQYFLIAFII